MTTGGSDRGVSELAGAILIFGAIVITLSVYQATVVPIQNERVEFDHNLDVQEDMQELRRAVLNAPVRGRSETVSVSLGVRYPARAILVNPAPATGSLRTETTGAPNVSIDNAAATGDVGDFWDGTRQDYETGGVVYQPAYNHYTDAPVTHYENSVVYNRFDAPVVNLTGQSLVDGRRVTLTALDGSVGRNGVGDTSIDVQSASPGHRTVTVSDSGGPITITFPTKLDLSTWNELLDGEFVANSTGGHVQDVSMTADPSAFDLLTIELEPGVTYELRLAKVVLGDTPDSTSVGYVALQDGNLSSIPTDQERQLTVEVRNRFNNPLSGETVTFSTSSPNVSLSDTEVVSDERGRAGVVVTASAAGNTTTSETIRAGIDTDGNGLLTDESPRLVVRFVVFVEPSS